ncbi:ribonuclease E inhibitor RraB [Gordonia hydrophobica]|uniref:Ribonuclease E inhibitor RraB n=1 Tax=Gordonia hydrophobica TaxID=40516 RepID=A0ABZ2TYE7_9ACTN|nr:ribonuclease E inhibitor RraB [Gordonia hydrophobica]MBM7367076.1 hypothetical protein [Gordonia hydrophobica]
MVTWKLPWRNSSAKTVPLAVGDPTLTVVVSGSDESVASSVALGEAGFDGAEPVVVRHLLAVPVDQREAVSGRCVVEGYEVDAAVRAESDDAGTVIVAMAQVMTVDAVTLSRARARMASIVSRVGGRVVGWALLRPADTPVTGATD